ncbi:pyranose 2-oxidase [Melanogaster broomeanus]|nr:pyranose 2-oxidase [Melanogaster broomeanus]
MSTHLTDETIQAIILNPSEVLDCLWTETDVLIAGSGPVGATYACEILEKLPNMRVIMAEIGSQDSTVIGAHHKNAVKYQKDIDSFGHIITGALQPISISPADTHISTMGGDGWRPKPQDVLIFQGHNPNQKPENNLKASSVTRTVGGMATHWTCNCPTPHEEERVKNPIKWEILEGLLQRGRELLNIHENEYDESIRHRVVRSTLQKALGESNVKNMPLAVQRRTDNKRYVTWSGTNTVLGDVVTNPNFTLWAEHRLTKVYGHPFSNGVISGALVRNLNSDRDIFAVVVCCGAVGTPQVLFNSGIRPPALGHYLSEQSLAFCQIVLKREIIEYIETANEFKELVAAHRKKYPNDPLPIPFSDPEPQVMIPYSRDHPYHVQVHHDAFTYGDVGPRADARVVVDLRYFGKQDIQADNCVLFGSLAPLSDWLPGVTDIYGMPQPTFRVTRSNDDHARDQKMMAEMTRVASILGAFLPGSLPQFMEPGLALHITGTTRIGSKEKPEESVADDYSRVHGYENLWVGGNGCIPDSTACNPTLTSVAIAIRGAEAVVKYFTLLA